MIIDIDTPILTTALGDLAHGVLRGRPQGVAKVLQEPCGATCVASSRVVSRCVMAIVEGKTGKILGKLGKYWENIGKMMRNMFFIGKSGIINHEHRRGILYIYIQSQAYGNVWKLKHGTSRNPKFAGA